MSIAQGRADGPKIVLPRMADDRSELQRHCGEDPDKWMEAAFASLTRSGWCLAMLNRLTMPRQHEWTRLILGTGSAAAIRRDLSDQNIPTIVSDFCGAEPRRWLDVAIVTLHGRDWSSPMIATVFGVSDSYVRRRRLAVASEIAASAS